MNNLHKNLTKLGFKQKEIEIYLTLLRVGRATPAELSKLTNIKRVTVYAITKTLVAKGIIAEDLAGKKVSLVALPPTELGNLIEKEKNAIEKKETLINQSIADLSQIFKTEKFSVPKIRYIEENTLEEFMDSRLEEWSENGKKIDGICWGFQDHTFVENYKTFLNWFWMHKNYGLTVKLLTNKSQIEEEVKKRYVKREIKFWNKNSQFTATTWIVGDYLIMINTREHPFYLLEIRDTTLAHNLREIFKNIWEEIR